ncbi:MAG: glycoside hydrolase family 36 protein [Promethearchaeota archaeon]
MNNIKNVQMKRSTIEQEFNKIRVIRDLECFEIKRNDNLIGFSIFNEDIFLKNATSALLIREGNKTIPYYPLLAENESFKPEITEFSDLIGSGFQIDIKCDFSLNLENPFKIPCLWRFKFYDFISKSCYISSRTPFVSIQIKIESIPSNIASFRLFGFAPLYNKNRGELNLYGRGDQENKKNLQDPHDITFYSNGWQSWSMNYVLGYEDKWPSSFVNLGRKILENQDKLLQGRYQSELHSVIYNKSRECSLVLGFITLKDQFSRILMDRLKSEGKITWLCAYSQTDSIQLNSLNKGLLSSEILIISLVSKPEPYEVLTEICNFGGILAEVKNSEKDALSGWCSWYYYYTKVTEQDVLSNLNYFKENRDLEISLIQLDDGYQTGIAEWGIYNDKFNSKFPKGLKWLAEQIHNSHFKAGLWVAPFFITKKSQLYKEHPEWLLRNEKNRKIIANNGWGTFQYGLDLSIDKTVEYIEDIGNAVSTKWNFDFLKIDFIYASELIEAKYKNPIYSRAQILRRGVKAIRDGLGNNRLLLGCGAPLGPCVGLVDVMRIGPDTAAVWTNLEPLFEDFLTVVSCNLKAALRSTIQRSYMHRTWWINDPDCVIVRENKSKLTYSEILLQLTVFGLSGGQFLISDDEKLVNKDRIELLKRLLPPLTLSNSENSFVVPLDIFSQKLPTLYARTTITAFGRHHLISVINWSKKTHVRNLKISDLIIYGDIKEYDLDSKFAVFNYWKENFEGIFSLNQEIELTIAPHGCEYLSIVPLPKRNANIPIFLSSTFHILQGVQELKDINIKSDEITIKLSLPGRRSGALFFYSDVPRNFECSHGYLSEFSYKSGLLLKIHAELIKEMTISLEWNEILEK